MTNKVPFNSLLVPTDFSENAWSAFQHARLLVDGDESEIVVVHVIDASVVNQVEQLGMGKHDDLLKAMREVAKKKLQRYSDDSDDATNVDTLVCEGIPFLEIIKKADDFAVDAIVMSKLGESSQADTLLFGSTAEKVTRGSRKPVIVLPSV